MAAYRRVYDSRHLQADCQEPGSAPEPHARQSSMDYLYLFIVCLLTVQSQCIDDEYALLTVQSQCIDDEYSLLTVQSQCIDDEYTVDGELFTLECRTASDMSLLDNMLRADKFQPHGNSLSTALLHFVVYFPFTTCQLWSAFSALTLFLGGRKGIRPVKKLSGGVLVWLSV